MIQQTLSDHSSLIHHTEHITGDKCEKHEKKQDDTRNMNITFIIEVPYTTHHNNNKL